jgi:hypothetical protein
MFVEPTYLSELLDPVNRVPRREVVCQRDLEREFGGVDQCDRPGTDAIVGGSRVER